MLAGHRVSAQSAVVSGVSVALVRVHRGAVGVDQQVAVLGVAIRRTSGRSTGCASSIRIGSSGGIDRGVDVGGEDGLLIFMRSVSWLSLHQGVHVAVMESACIL
jgi:hypothetical protein